MWDGQSTKEMGSWRLKNPFLWKSDIRTNDLSWVITCGKTMNSLTLKKVVIPCRKVNPATGRCCIYQAWSFSTGVKYLPDPAALIILTHSTQLLWRTLSNKSGHIGRPRVLCLSDLIKFVKSLDRVLQLLGLTRSPLCDLVLWSTNIISQSNLGVASLVQMPYVNYFPDIA